ncbi:septin-8 isoform X5 [Brachionus plicatilis]|uniref:Septin n=1 Tax=Brachionus plicatilis TaxID=10195 RepID=A0A3M7SQJ7_BRAPC|nr:septin-8 isoform X5 [Brachionus plicatilis]
MPGTSSPNDINQNFTRIITSEPNTKQNASSLKEIKNVKLKGYVGFERIADQYVSKMVRDGISFNILCIGETGIGKSTLIDTLFNTNLNTTSMDHCSDKVSLVSNTFELKEKNINLKLTVIETSGYGDQINKANSHEEILKYINEQYENYVQEELGLKRQIKQINDKRVHLCLYFICPTGHSLKAIDLNTMKALDSKVNIVPIIAKADTICKNELIDFKKRIMDEIFKNEVNIYQFPINENEPSVNNQNLITNSLYPLAVIGSSQMVKVGNKVSKGRQYEWGTVSIENEMHCDFVKLRESLLSTNLFDLIELTHIKHYQMYRANRLREIGFFDDLEADTDQGDFRTIKDVYIAKKSELDEVIQRNEIQIKEEFVKKVKAKEQEIKEIEKELNGKFNQWKSEQNEWRDRIEFKRRELDDQIREFNERKFSLDKLKLSTLSSNKYSKKK